MIYIVSLMSTSKLQMSVYHFITVLTGGRAAHCGAGKTFHLLLNVTLQESGNLSRFGLKGKWGSRVREWGRRVTFSGGAWDSADWSLREHALSHYAVKLFTGCLCLYLCEDQTEFMTLGERTFWLLNIIFFLLGLVLIYLCVMQDLG